MSVVAHKQNSGVPFARHILLLYYCESRFCTLALVLNQSPQIVSIHSLVNRYGLFGIDRKTKAAREPTLIACCLCPHSSCKSTSRPVACKAITVNRGRRRHQVITPIRRYSTYSQKRGYSVFGALPQHIPDELLQSGSGHQLGQ